MQGTEFGADHQHTCLRIRLAKGLGRPQRREGCVAAHKAEVVPLDSRIQAEGPDDLVVRAGIEESGAGNRDQVGDVPRLDARAGIEGFLGCFNEKLGRFRGEDVVPDLGAGAEHQAGGGVEELGVFRLAVRGEFLHRRVPGVDGGGVKARADEPGSEPGEARLGGEHGPGLGLDQDGWRDCSFQRPQVDRHGSFSASLPPKTMERPEIQEHLRAGQLRRDVARSRR